jgi:regulator of replication initiation timing
MKMKNSSTHKQMYNNAIVSLESAKTGNYYIFNTFIEALKHSYELEIQIKENTKLKEESEKLVHENKKVMVKRQHLERTIQQLKEFKKSSDELMTRKIKTYDNFSIFWF